MGQKYEYKFVRLGEGWFEVKRTAIKGYQNMIEDHAREGWRFIQVFAPSLGVYGVSKYIELIFEREVG